MKTLPIGYGRCPCTGKYENRSVQVRMTVGGRNVVLNDVPQGACPLCGSRVYKSEVLERIEALMHQHEVSRRDDRALKGSV